MGKVACALVVALLGGGGAAKQMETVVQDDALLLHRPPAQVREAARQMAELGFDRVRITAGWAVLSPRPTARTVPGGDFDPADPATYPQERWRSLDTAVRAVREAGMQVQLDVAFWAPRWAVARGSTNPARQRHRPDAALFGAFARAVAERYDGTFPDPADPDRTLPTVRQYTTWNEPNHPSFLAPQWVRDGRHLRPYSPHVYRPMHNAAYDAIKAVSERNAVLMGGTASQGSHSGGRGGGGVPPMRFVRELACVDERLEPLDVPECEGFRPLRADGFAHHPYSRDTVPGRRARNSDMAPIADGDRLAGLLQALHERRRIDRPLGLYFTEYGYETKPPDPFQRHTPEQQAAFIGWSAYLAWKQPTVNMHAQFLLRDIDAAHSGRRPGTRGHWRDFQTGLQYADGTPKPAAQAFRLPLHAEVRHHAGRQALVLFGGVRPGHRARLVRVEAQSLLTGRWEPVHTIGPSSCNDGQATFATDEAGYFERLAVPQQAARYRLVGQMPDGRWETGPAVELVGPFEGLLDLGG